MPSKLLHIFDFSKNVILSYLTASPRYIFMVDIAGTFYRDVIVAHLEDIDSTFTAL